MLASAVIGFVEGLVAPVVELVDAIFIMSGLAIIQTIGNPIATSAFSLVGLIRIQDFARNIIIGLCRSEFAIGNLFGNLFGIALFYSAIVSVSADAAVESLLLTVVLLASFIVGCIIVAYGLLAKSS